MDRISELPEDLILKILSSVPTKVSVTTSLLSKRWCYLWKHVPKLSYRDLSDQRASRFVSTFLLLNKAIVLESLHLSLGEKGSPEDMETWTSIAVSRGVRYLLYSRVLRTLRPAVPKSLYSCETLVTLVLISAAIVDVPLKICLPSLKDLFLLFVDFLSDENFGSLLSGCPVLTKLSVVVSDARVKIFTISVPSLQCLTIVDVRYGYQFPADDVGFVIKAPSLNSLAISSEFCWVCSSVKMPCLVKANVKLPHSCFKKFRGCLTSAKHLSLCLQPPLDPSIIGVFDQLVSLNLCTCSLDWCGVMLRNTPKLRVLRFVLYQEKLCPKRGIATIRKCRSYGDSCTQWEQPSSVPPCLISSLETVEWIDYKGTQTEKETVMYFLKNSGRLKKVSIRSLASSNLNEKHKMLLELASAQRSSNECRLLFT